MHKYNILFLCLLFITKIIATCEPVNYCNCRKGVDRYGCPLCLCPPCNLCCKYGEFDTIVYFKNIDAWCPNDCYIPKSGIVINPYYERCPYPYA